MAVAIEDAFRELAPAVRVRILAPLADRTGTGLLSPGRWYDTTVAHAPWAWGRFYQTTDNAWAVRFGMAVGAWLWARPLRDALQTTRPALVVSVHPLCTRLAAAVLRTMPDPPPLHCVVTDLVTIHRCWACAAVNAFYVATAEARDALIALGIRRARIHMTGLPVRASFAQSPPALPDAAVPHVLLLGGGSPSHRVEQIARAGGVPPAAASHRRVWPQ